MSADFLQKIVEHKRQLLKEKQPFLASLKKKIIGNKLTSYGLFKKAISKPGQMNLIAEIKKASPSQGIIRKDFDVMGLARIYVDNGAAAISILTEEKFFLGKPPYIRQVSDHFAVPLLTKDFIIDEVQIYEAFYLGTSAILLIVAILTDEEIKHLMAVARSLDLDCLVEAHDERELERALKADAEIIGINNRDLHTFEVDIKTSEKLIPKIPPGKIIVAESGIKTHAEVQLLQNLGAHAVLIGETFLREADVASKIREVMYGNL